MTLKELFTKVDEANAILRPMVEREITVTVEFDGADTVEFKDYKQFTSWVDTNFFSWFATVIYNLDLVTLQPLTRVTIEGEYTPFEIVIMLNVCDIK